METTNPVKIRESRLEGCLGLFVRGLFLYLPAVLFWAWVATSWWNGDGVKDTAGIHYTIYKAKDSNGSSFDVQFYVVDNGEIYPGPDINGWGLKVKVVGKKPGQPAQVIVTDSRGGRAVFSLEEKYSHDRPVFKLEKKTGEFLISYPEGKLWSA